MNGIQAITWSRGHPAGLDIAPFLWQGTAIAVLYTVVRFLFARVLSASARYTLCVHDTAGDGVAPR